MRFNFLVAIASLPTMVISCTFTFSFLSFDDKGFKNAEVIISQKDDVSNDNQVIVDIDIDKKEKVKVHEITIVGNEAIATKKLKRIMKKTNEKNKLLNLFRTKKFVEENFEADKQLIIDKYNELGYRDAMIVEDSIKPYDDRTVDIFMKIDEGEKYYLRNVTWVGNTLYPSEQLNFMLRMKKGDVYNQKLLEERTMSDEDAIGNLYYNNGYLFYSLEPVEVNIVGDSIDLEMRIYEGRQATINKISINGNDRLYENDAALLETLRAHKIDLVVLAGFLSVLGPSVIAAYPRRILNVHPALIPSFCGTGTMVGASPPGCTGSRACKVTGATVHFVNEEC